MQPRAASSATRRRRRSRRRGGRARRRPPPRSSRGADSRITPSGTSVAARSALLNGRLARRLLVGRRLRQLVGRDDLIVGGGVGVDRRRRARRGRRERAARRRERRAVVVRCRCASSAAPPPSCSSDAPTADASADADPPPGVGSGELNAASRVSRRRAISMLPSRCASHDTRPFLTTRADGVRADANQIDGRAVDDDGVHLLARLEAADRVVAVERVRAR